ncbi:MAG TPA: TlpA disulfide reductase family protein [Microthrixaceae bacterium]|nr:TlpA disulfide reductase family protein [Microthrixaceae bacterium]
MSNPPESQTPLSQTPRRPMRLPFGPFGMLIITAISLLVAFGVAMLAVNLLSDDDSKATNIRDALDDVTVTPAVPDGQSTVKIGDNAPNVKLAMLDGGSEELSKFVGNGTPAVLNFWSSTCAPCLNEMPALESVSKKLGDSVAVLGINTQDTVESGKKMVKQTGVTFPNARDPRGEISTVFGALALPRTVLIDGNGKIVATHSGELTAEKFVKLLDENDFPTP